MIISLILFRYIKQIVANELEVCEKTEMQVTLLVVCVEVKPCLLVDFPTHLVSKPEGHSENNREKLWLKVIKNLKTNEQLETLSLAWLFTYHICRPSLSISFFYLKVEKLAFSLQKIGIVYHFLFQTVTCCDMI